MEIQIQLCYWILAIGLVLQHLLLVVPLHLQEDLGITDSNVDLSPTGGLLAFLVNAQGVPDKFEIVHNSAKKATSGMTSLNSGTYDNIYGTTPSNTIPTSFTDTCCRSIYR